MVLKFGGVNSLSTEVSGFRKRANYGSPYRCLHSLGLRSPAAFHNDTCRDFVIEAIKSGVAFPDCWFFSRSLGEQCSGEGEDKATNIARRIKLLDLITMLMDRD